LRRLRPTSRGAWDLGLDIDFPPGSTILIPRRETCYSFGEGRGFYGKNNAGVESKGAGLRAVVERQSKIVFKDV
jgi:hypothetical protein